MTFGDLQRLELKPGEQFVLTVPTAVTSEMEQRLRRAWKEFVGGDDDKFRLLILQQGMKLGVIKLAKELGP